MNKLSVVVRFHDLARLFELRRCLFSLVCQSYGPLEICLITQRFSKADTSNLKEAVAPILALNQRVQLEIYNYAEPLPQDARAILLNLGIKQASGKYLAFLDHDDTIFPPSYGTLIQELERSDAAIGFGSVAYKDVDVFQDALLVDRRLAAFVGNSLIDLFDHNFCPIHSFVIDKSQVDPEDLTFDTTLTKHEDYEFLLRICAKYKSSFALIGTFVGDYYLKNDGSNSNTWLSGETEQTKQEWEQSTAFLNTRKSQILLSDAVQKELGVPKQSIAELLHVMMGKDDHS